MPLLSNRVGIERVSFHSPGYQEKKEDGVVGGGSAQGSGSLTPLLLATLAFAT